MSGVDFPQPPCRIKCPECDYTVWCSEEDPYAGFSDMGNHVYDHAVRRAGSDAEAHMFTLGLLAKVEAIPDA